MKSLPHRPSLEFLKKQAKQLRAQHRERAPQFCDHIRQFDTSYQTQADDAIFNHAFSINDAQRIVAREYGFASWTKLKRYIEAVTGKKSYGVSDRKAYHKTITDSYDERSKNYYWSKWHRDIAHRLVDYHPPKTGQHVLDIATGTGTIPFHCARLIGPQGSAIGVDISTGMINKANAFLKGSQFRNLSFMVADGEHLEFSANTFDRIYCANAFFWMEDHLAALKHWHTMSRVGGIVGFTAWPDSSFIWGSLAQRVLDKYGIYYALNRPTASEERCAEIMQLAGFENIDIRVVEDGDFITLEAAKGGWLQEDHYAPAQYPHPLTGVDPDILKQAEADYDAELEKMNTDKGIWNDLTMYYIYGTKPDVTGS